MIAALVVMMSVGCSANPSTIPDSRTTPDASSPIDGRPFTADAAVLDASGPNDARATNTDSSAAPQDANVDAVADALLDAAIPPDALPRGLVTVVIYDDNGDPAAQNAVIFQDTDGTITETTTDITGTSAVTVNQGATVTVIQNDRGTLLQSIEGVAPNDVLTFGQPSDTGGGAFDLTLEVPDGGEGQVETEYGSACGISTVFGGFETSVGITVPFACSSVALLSDTRASIDGVLDYLLYVESNVQTITADADLTIPGPWLNAPLTSLSIDNVPSPAIVTKFDESAWSGNSSITGISLPTPSTYQAQIPLSHHLPPFGDSVQVITEFTDGASGNQLFTEVANSPITEIDASSVLLPWIDDYATYDAVSRNVQWSSTGSGNADIYFVVASYMDGNGDSVTWTVLAPGSATSSIEMPVLPVSQSVYEPGSAQSSDAEFVAQLIAGAPSLDYASIRQNHQYDEKFDVLILPRTFGNVTMSSNIELDPR